jgi:hypothetical protein
MTTSATEEQQMAELARVLNILEASQVTPAQFWNRFNESREMRFAMMFSINACIRKLVAYRDQVPMMSPLEPVQSDF